MPVTTGGAIGNDHQIAGLSTSEIPGNEVDVDQNGLQASPSQVIRPGARVQQVLDDTPGLPASLDHLHGEPEDHFNFTSVHAMGDGNEIQSRLEVSQTRSALPRDEGEYPSEESDLSEQSPRSCQQQLNSILNHCIW